jgi:hypothetical protein
MIIRIPQLKIQVDTHDFVCEFLGDDQEWHYLKNPCYSLKNAKVRIHEGVVFLIGYTFSSKQEEQNYRKKYFTNTKLEWNDDRSQYAYCEWEDFFKAYY